VILSIPFKKWSRTWYCATWRRVHSRKQLLRFVPNSGDICRLWLVIIAALTTPSIAAVDLSLGNVRRACYQCRTSPSGRQLRMLTDDVGNDAWMRETGYRPQPATHTSHASSALQCASSVLHYHTAGRCVCCHVLSTGTTGCCNRSCFSRQLSAPPPTPPPPPPLLCVSLAVSSRTPSITRSPEFVAIVVIH